MINNHKFCPICASENPSDAKFCISCGSPFQATSAHSASGANSVPEESFSANLSVGAASLGGKRNVYSDRIEFVPHAINLSRTPRIYQLADVCGYHKGFLTNLSVFLMNGQEVLFQVWHKDTVIKTIEDSRQSWFSNQGLEIPHLIRF